MAGNNSFQERQKNVLDDNLNIMWGKHKDAPDDAKNPNLKVVCFNQKPRVVVYTNIPNSPNNGKIEFQFNMIQFQQFIAAIKSAATSDKECDYRIQMDQYNSKDPKKPYKMILGIDRANDGILFLFVSAFGRSMRFDFDTITYAPFVDKNGEKITGARHSNIIALARAHYWNEFAIRLYYDNYVYTDSRNTKSDNNRNRNSNSNAKSGDTPPDYSDGDYQNVSDDEW